MAGVQHARPVDLPVAADRLLGRRALSEALGDDRTPYAGRTVMITGAGGSIGAELCRQILACRPATLVLFEMSEVALYTVDMALRSEAARQGTELVAVLGSVADPAQVARVFTAHDIAVVIHAAAYKHVPLVEINPLSGIANNGLGTHVLARAAQAAGVGRFLLVSSDKAVRPTNVMGASKRLAELVVQDFAGRGGRTVFGIVRFGNVLASSGSVVHRFREQIRTGGPVTVTDPRVTRYFMTVQEAVRLVLRAGAMAQGGEVYVLDMGRPVPIVTLARQMIEAAGHRVRAAQTVESGIEIVFTGLRPGEKLIEELSLSGSYKATAHPKIFAAQEPGLSEIEVAALLRSLTRAVAASDVAGALAILVRWIEGYGAASPEEAATGAVAAEISARPS